MLRAERQSARMSKITNDGLTRSGTGCFIAVPIWQQWFTTAKLSVAIVSLLLFAERPRLPSNLFLAV